MSVSLNFNNYEMVILAFRLFQSLMLASFFSFFPKKPPKGITLLLYDLVKHQFCYTESMVGAFCLVAVMGR